MASNRRNRNFAFSLLQIYGSLDGGVRVTVNTPLVGFTISYRAWAFDEDARVSGWAIGFLQNFLTCEGDYVYRWRKEHFHRVPPIPPKSGTPEWHLQQIYSKEMIRQINDNKSLLELFGG